MKETKKSTSKKKTTKNATNKKKAERKKKDSETEAGEGSLVIDMDDSVSMDMSSKEENSCEPMETKVEPVKVPVPEREDMKPCRWVDQSAKATRGNI